jgi:hypothetical protein
MAYLGLGSIGGKHGEARLTGTRHNRRTMIAGLGTGPQVFKAPCAEYSLLVYLSVGFCQFGKHHNTPKLTVTLSHNCIADKRSYT